MKIRTRPDRESRCRPYYASRTARRSRSGFHFVRDRFAAPLSLGQIVA